MRILFCGGGTVGHISPSLAVAERLLERYKTARVAFVGRLGGKENEVIRRAGFPLYEIEAYPFSGSVTPKNLKRLYKTAFSVKGAMRIIDEFAPDGVFATGGYVSFPMIRGARRAKIPYFLHESNAVSGLVTRVMARRAKLVFVGMNSDEGGLLSLKNAIVSGNPTRRAFGSVGKKEARRRLGIRDNERLILSVGGSGGAMRINEVILELIEALDKKSANIKIIHSTGRSYFGQFTEKMKDLGIDRGALAIEFISDMPLYLAAADIVISRAGAMTLAEIKALGTPAVIIPSPNVAKNHQMKNALSFVSDYDAKIIEEKELDRDALWGAIDEVLSRAAAHAPATCAEVSGERSPADIIIDNILSTL